MKNTPPTHRPFPQTATLIPAIELPSMADQFSLPLPSEASAMIPQPSAPAAAAADDIPGSFAPISAVEAMALSLSPAQRKAIELLTSGSTLAAAATAAGVNRTTLYRWLKGDAAFVAAFNAWQKDVLDTARGRILALSDLAVTTVAKALTCGDAKTAMRLLKSIGVLDRPKPGATDPEEIERQQSLEHKKAKTAARAEESRAALDDVLTF